MNFLEQLWKHDNIRKKEKNMIDSIIDAIGEPGLRELKMTGVDLKELLTEYAETSKKPMKRVRVLSPKKDAVKNYRERRDDIKERDKNKNRREAKDKQITANVRHNLPSKRGLKDDPTGRFNFPFQEQGLEPTYDDLEENESTAARTRALAEESKQTDWTEYLQKSKRTEPYLLWTKETLPKSRGKTLENVPFMIDALMQVKRKENTKLINDIIRLLPNQSKDRNISDTQNVWTKTGKDDKSMIRPLTDQERVLDSLLDTIQYGHDFETKRNAQGESLKRTVQETEILSVKFLLKLSDSIYLDEKHIHPKITQRIKTTEGLLPKLIQFLKSKKKTLPRRASMKAALDRLSTKGRGRNRIITLLINNPEEYVFNEETYSEDLSKINKIISDNLSDFNETVEPLVNQGTYDWKQYNDSLIKKYRDNRDSIGQSRTEYVGDEMVKLIDAIKTDVDAIKKPHKAKLALIKIGSENGKSNTINNEEYNNFLQNLNLITDNSYWKTYSKGTSDIVESKKPNTANELRTSRTSIEDKAKQRIKESVKLLEREIKDLTEMEEKRGNVPYFAESKKTIRNKIDKLKEKYPEMFKEE